MEPTYFLSVSSAGGPRRAPPLSSSEFFFALFGAIPDHVSVSDNALTRIMYQLLRLGEQDGGDTSDNIDCCWY